MEIFSVLLAICAGNSPVPGEFPSQRPVTRSIDVFFDLRLNNRLSKQSCGWWFETLSRPLWRQCNAMALYNCVSGNLWGHHPPDMITVWYVKDVCVELIWLIHRCLNKIESYEDAIFYYFSWLKMFLSWLEFSNVLFRNLQLGIRQYQLG